MATQVDQQLTIEAEQIRLVYRNTVRTPFGIFMLLAALVYLVVSETGSPWPYAWSAAILAMHFVRSFMIRRALRRELAPAELMAHSRTTRAMTTFMGVLIAVGVLSFFARLSAETQALVTMVCIGWLAGVVGVFGAYPRYIRRWFILFGGSLALAWLVHLSAETVVISVLLALLVFFLWMTINDIGGKTVDSIRIRFENVELLERLKARQQELEEVSMTKSRFMTAASHDLRQPLMSIALLQASLAQARTLDDARAVARKLGAPIESLESTLDSLVDIARLDAGIVKPRLEPTALADIGARLRDEFGPRLESVPLALDVQADDACVMLDAHLTTRILRNLIDNAIKFTASGHIDVAMRLQPGDRLAVTVRDTGRGIAKGDLPRVFDEYYRGEGTASGAKGLGLGLSIVRRIVLILGGDIAIDSTEGAGTIVRLVLPATAAQAVAAAPAEATATAPHVLARNLLFVDDDREIQDAVSMWAAHAGVAVIYASTGDEALHYAQSAAYRPDVVVSDYQMPGALNGLELLRRLRERWPAVPAILLTGNSDQALPRAAAAQGIGFLPKPISVERFEAAIREIVARPA